MRKMYLSAPLPFVGQKRMLAKEFMKVLEQYPDGTLFVDLFGGSGLLSHITKSLKPHSTVIYNDFDNYRFRMKHIPQTNQLLADIREMVGNSVPRHKIIKGELVMTAYQRSSDANLGLPADIYHLYLISRQIELPLKSITLNLGNVHIYENNIDKTEQLLAGNENVKFELNV